MNTDGIPENISLLEALADIAHVAGLSQYYGGNSREDIDKFIEWAQEFEKLHAGREWGVELDYIETIEAFTQTKMKAKQKG